MPAQVATPTPHVSHEVEMERLRLQRQRQMIEMQRKELERERALLAQERSVGDGRGKGKGNKGKGAAYQAPRTSAYAIAVPAAGICRARLLLTKSRESIVTLTHGEMLVYLLETGRQSKRAGEKGTKCKHLEGHVFAMQR